ncbi:DUF402 domain-containing protein [Shimazuella sp. AN120528]|uniref:DUF402 domain-containing protein n=1 Tax=Shimazuella soli TaxID=1892854 RepID=UPI001F0F0246|nr:DUF402 domain-containing protein [Shimazuella soli]MCH5586583.1 DUF402 domain-containing protein [Shimazuella soli]
MIPFQVGEVIDINSYKHGGEFHRQWKGSKVLSSDEILIVSNYHPKVTESDGRIHTYPGLSIALFFPEEWWNIVMIYRYNKRLVSYYCNIASPFCMDRENACISYIDYDIDLIVRPNQSFKVVDEHEFVENSQKYSYPNSILKRVELAVKQLTTWVKKGKIPFTKEFASHWYHQYLSLELSGVNGRCNM